MCGIVGGTKQNWNIQAGVRCLHHRGPDSNGFSSHADVTMGFARLAIIDLSREADQPMAAAEGQAWIVFNGEIYGFQRLREELKNKGHLFRTHSDTEVLLKAYLQWGDEFIKHVDGMFAIAIHDRRSRQLKLFRDRCGIKPLYYFYDGSEFAFASELKGIKNLCSDVSFNIDYTALYDYLTYSYIPEPKTYYKNVFRLLPGHQLTIDLATKRITNLSNYWTLPVLQVSYPTDINVYEEKLRYLIKESVKDQLVADVPVGCFLSGGLDSSTIVAVASELKPNLETFTIGFDQKSYSETDYAQLVANKFKTRHRTKILSFSQTAALYQNLKTWYDEPFADISAFPSFLVAQYAKENMTVVLTGDGGDEVLGGYSRFQWAQTASKFPRWPTNTPSKFISKLRSRFGRAAFLRKILFGLDILVSEPITSYSLLMGGLQPTDKIKYAQEWNIPNDYDSYWYYRKYYRPELPLLTRLQYLDFHTYLPSDILTKVDRVTMAVSLEARVPFLSQKLVEFCFSIPQESLYHKGKLKGLLKSAYADILPPAILNRGKMGFGLPPRYLNTDKEWIQEKILKEVFT